MIVILSPAKNMKINSFSDVGFEKPIFYDEINIIVEHLRKLSPQEIEKVMKVNGDIAFRVFSYFKEFNIDEKNTHALACYDGLVFKNIDVTNFDKDDILFANEHIKILSGVYGILSAFTYIQPYRLEMGSKVLIDGNNLYNFWGDKIYNELYKNNDVVLNLASNEYSKVVTKFLKDDDKFINVDFLVFKDGKYKTVATSAKIARGQMSNYIIKNKINNVNELKYFYNDTYKYNEMLSNENNLIFTS